MDLASIILISFVIIFLLLRFRTSKKAQELIKNGSLVLDVRSIGEYDSGHFPESINIPLDMLSDNISKLKEENKTIVVVCASGMRSASACSILKNNNISCLNGGSWSSLK